MISIIVPVYNAENFIADTIGAVTGQTYSDWELILVDDCSTDGSTGVIEEKIAQYKERNIRLIRMTEGGSAAAARNRGLIEAKGRYIAFLDADDMWAPEKLEKELNFMGEKGAGFVFTAYDFGDENAASTGKTVHVPATLSYKQALSRTVIFTSTVLLDTEIVDRGLIRMPLVPSEDSATWWQILKSGVTGYGLDESLVIYRRPGKSLSSNKLKAVKRIWNLYRKVEKISIPESAVLFLGWAFRTTARRL